MESYRTIEGTSLFEFEEKKSRFIGRAAHVTTEQEAQEFLQFVRNENKEARHNVFAFTLREGNLERQSDDGEPQKTAGLPTLEVLRHSGLQDCIIVTTRYFGGTLLGTGGLVRAYTQAAQGALAAATQVLVSSVIDIAVEMPYSAYDQAAYIIGKHPAKIIDTSFTSDILIELQMVEGTERPLIDELTKLLRGDDGIMIGEPHHGLF